MRFHKRRPVIATVILQNACRRKDNSGLATVVRSAADLGTFALSRGTICPNKKFASSALAETMMCIHVLCETNNINSLPVRADWRGNLRFRRANERACASARVSGRSGCAGRG